jgi:hypothetical protein
VSVVSRTEMPYSFIISQVAVYSLGNNQDSVERISVSLSWQWRRLDVPALEKQSIIFGACGFSFLSLIFYYSTEVPYSSGHDSLRAFAKA